MNNFAEFVKAFCDFGLEMVELSVTTRWHLNQVPHHQCWWNFFWKNSRKSFTNEDPARILVKFTMILNIENIKNSGKGTAATSSDWVRSLCTRQVVEKAIFFSMKLENMFLDWNLSSRNFFLHRSTVLLVSSTKCCLRHLDSASARENRDTVFCQVSLFQFSLWFQETYWNRKHHILVGAYGNSFFWGSGLFC